MNNESIARLPKHLKKYIVEQRYDEYTPIDHAVWRYVMRVNLDFFSKHAHSSYVNGLKATGISLDHIPNIVEMNTILSKIGWGAVCVDGFIPPTSFMEFQAYNVLVIAADIRNINHIEYTPAPDIIHEAAGHAPIISDPEYAEYLRLFGAIGSKALSSKRDNDLYEAIRRLSILKENPNSTETEISNAERLVIEIQNDMGEPSEMAMIRNLHWWTVEYGLIGDLGSPKIYGAGLLSSIGESSSCLGDSVVKIPYSIDAANFSFDITTKQPQLFVAKDFRQLTMVLNEFARSMAFRKGGADSVEKAINSGSLATVELSSGIQVSGHFVSQIIDLEGNTAYLLTNGPTTLNEREHQLIGHGAEIHSHGFGTPVGNLVGIEKNIEDISFEELSDFGIETGKKVVLNFKSGITVDGEMKFVRSNKFGKLLIMTFENCTVRLGEKLLFDPSWGIYDMAVGSSVTAVFAGPADKSQSEAETYISETNTSRVNNHPQQLLDLYADVRRIRDSKKFNIHIFEIFETLKLKFEDDWLLTLEIYEMLYNEVGFEKHKHEIRDYLCEKAKNEDVRKLIIDGLRLVEN